MNRFLSLLLLLSAALVLPSKAAVIYTGTPIPIPQDFNGISLNPLTGTSTGAYPTDWSSAPWINPFFGGVDIATSPLFLPAITGADQIVNVALGAVIDGATTFALGESGSSTHMGLALNQFQLSTPGYIGFTFKPGVGGPSYYGWMQIVISNTGVGSIVEYAYDDTADTGIAAGFTGLAAPEPGRAVLLLLGAVACALRRRR